MSTVSLWQSGKVQPRNSEARFNSRRTQLSGSIPQSYQPDWCVICVLTELLCNWASDVWSNSVILVRYCCCCCVICCSLLIYRIQAVFIVIHVYFCRLIVSCLIVTKTLHILSFSFIYNQAHHALYLLCVRFFQWNSLLCQVSHKSIREALAYPKSMHGFRTSGEKENEREVWFPGKMAVKLVCVDICGQFSLSM